MDNLAPNTLFTLEHWEGRELVNGLTGVKHNHSLYFVNTDQLVRRGLGDINFADENDPGLYRPQADITCMD
jgi:hypothetical protein